MKKGFTLVELIAVIVILVVILIVSVPNTIISFKKQKDLQYDEAVTTIINAADLYIQENRDNIELNQLVEPFNFVLISLKKLKANKYLDEIINPKTNKNFDPNSFVKVYLDENGVFQYEYPSEFEYNIKIVKKEIILNYQSENNYETFDLMDGVYLWDTNNENKKDDIIITLKSFDDGQTKTDPEELLTIFDEVVADNIFSGKTIGEYELEYKYNIDEEKSITAKRTIIVQQGKIPNHPEPELPEEEPPIVVDKSGPVVTVETIANSISKFNFTVTDESGIAIIKSAYTEKDLEKNQINFVDSFTVTPAEATTQTFEIDIMPLFYQKESIKTSNEIAFNYYIYTKDTLGNESTYKLKINLKIGFKEMFSGTNHIEIYGVFENGKIVAKEDNNYNSYSRIVTYDPLTKQKTFVTGDLWGSSCQNRGMGYFIKEVKLGNNNKVYYKIENRYVYMGANGCLYDITDKYYEYDFNISQEISLTRYNNVIVTSNYYNNNYNNENIPFPNTEQLKTLNGKYSVPTVLEKGYIAIVNQKEYLKYTNPDFFREINKSYTSSVIENKFGRKWYNLVFKNGNSYYVLCSASVGSGNARIQTLNTLEYELQPTVSCSKMD